MTSNNEKEFHPDSFQIELSHDEPDTIFLVWESSTGERQVEALRKNQLPQVLLELQKQIPAGSAVPINRGSLRPGMLVSPTGFGFGPRPDHFRLTMFVDLPEEGRGVEIPIRFSAKDAREIVQALTRWLKDQGDA